MINIRQAKTAKDFNWIQNAMQNNPGIKEIFQNKMDRLVCSSYSFIIYSENTPVGFINLVDEHVNGYLFIDAGILREYRNNNYGTIALNNVIKLINIYTDNILIAEIKEDNIAAIKSVINNDAKYIGTTNGINYYILNYDKFLEKDSSFQDTIFNYLRKKER